MTSSVDAAGPAFETVEPVLSTPWSAQVGPGNALPEYPRPRLVRERWLNLNGVWEYAGSGAPRRDGYGERILVPFPPESALSGIGRRDETLWYRKVFHVPPGWDGQRVLLHFGSVDQSATVRVNNQEVAVHEGGYTAFSADITDVLRPSGSQELTVRVTDRTDAATYPVGKQRNDPKGIFYTAASGIWQTVWLEPVPSAHIRDLPLTPDLDGVTVVPKVTGGARVELIVSEPGGAEVTRVEGAVGQRLRTGWACSSGRTCRRSPDLDPTRHVVANSGVNCCFPRPDTGAGDVYDDHTYVGPGSPAVKDHRVIVDGEYGGLGLVVDGHRRPGEPQAYEMTPTPAQLTKRYAEVSEHLERIVAGTGLSGAIYTQTTDVENEVNGLLTYDRRVVKADAESVATCNRAVIETGQSG